MFDFLGVVIEGFVWFWILIIATVPNFFMGGLTIAVAGTVLTYFSRRTKEKSK